MSMTEIEIARGGVVDRILTAFSSSSKPHRFGKVCFGITKDYKTCYEKSKGYYLVCNNEENIVVGPIQVVQEYLSTVSEYFTGHRASFDEICANATVKKHLGALPFMIEPGFL